MNRTGTFSIVLACLTAGCYGSLSSEGMGGSGVAGAAGAAGPAAPGGGLGGAGGEGGAGGRSAAAVTFRPSIQADLDAEGCTSASCHGAGRAPMTVAPSPRDSAGFRANYDEVKVRTAAGGGALVDKAAGGSGHPHILEATGETATRWRAWVAAGAPFEAAAQPRPDAAPTTPRDGGARDAGRRDGGATRADGGTSDGAAALTWEADIGPMLGAAGCTRCHGTAGRYSVETYAQALAAGSDTTPNVVPGDASSVLVMYGEAGHQGLRYELALQVRRWVLAGARE